MLSDVLSEIGWDRKFALPMSNTENKALEDEVRRKKERKKTKLSTFKKKVEM